MISSDAAGGAPTLGVLGGTGPAGQALAAQFAGIGIEVVLGSRSVERAEASVAEIRQRWVDRDLALVPGNNADAASAGIVIVATPWDGVPALLGTVSAKLHGKVVVTMVNALTRWGPGMVPLIPPTGSVTAAIAGWLPDSDVVGAFHHLPAGLLADLDHNLDADVMVCGDSSEAKHRVIALIDQLPGLRGIDAGGVASALAIEALTPALLEVNRRYRTHAALRLTGI